MNWKNLFLAAVAYMVIAEVLGTAFAFLSMDYYTNPQYFPLWSEIMMPNNGSPGADFYAYSIIFDTIVGAAFAYAFLLTKQALIAKKPFKADRFWQLGLKYGVFLFGVAQVPGFFAMYLTLAIPLGLLLVWLVQGLAISLAFGVACAKLL